ncbi:6731_t:CDS:2 [Acaulospora morrowiae]|uniref:6731_t:CDS:1 n=1 Tax=Acaulospora morrowiae TaxID=94023 RepID=A0A9N8WKB8_9GLOM|nr:6731_t:CDS:2 [Acaulospora morrowiae]
MLHQLANSLVREPVDEVQLAEAEQAKKSGGMDDDNSSYDNGTDFAHTTYVILSDSTWHYESRTT